MKKALQKNSVNIALLSVIFFITSLFLTLDTYCKNEITTETPLLKIANLPFLRTDFVLILFTLTFLVGALLSVLLKKKSIALVPFAVGALGVMAVFVGVFDVNLMQILSPTMRISHVIMTVSRVLAIVSGASGIFAGFAVTALLKSEINVNVVTVGALVSIAASAAANAENLQNSLYIVCAVLLLSASVILDFSEKPSMNDETVKKDKIVVFFEFMSTLLLTVAFGISYASFREYSGLGDVSFTIISGFILLLLFAGLRQVNIVNALSLFSGSALSFVLVHYASEVITYSGNRVIYIIHPIIAVVALVLGVLLSAVKKAVK